ncbi:MAG: radical SAM protein [Candidatus Omnitrophota bacterium]
MGEDNNIPLDSCDLGIAYQCMLECKMCHFWHKSQLSEDNILSIESWKTVLKNISQLKRTDNFMINIGGPGEPFLRKGIFELISTGRKLGLPIQVITNGFIVDKGIVEKIDESGLSFLCFSLDSLDPQIHDFLRGKKGVQEKLMKTIDLVAQECKQIKIGINNVISKVNLAGIIDVINWAENDPKISYINFQAIAQPFSYTEALNLEWFKSDKYKFLWPDDEKSINEIMDSIIALKNKNFKIANSITQLNVFRKYFLNPEEFIKNSRCNLGRGNVLVIDPAGNVSMCQLVGIIDRINKEKSLFEIIASDKTKLHKKNINACRRNCHLIVSCYYQDETN